MFSKKKTIKVGVTITIDNRMEVAVVDTELRKVIQYQQTEVGYNFQNKELTDYLQFASALRNIMDEMKLNVKDTEITITIPSIHLSTTQLQSSFDDSAIRTVLATYAQDSYLFKKHEPEIAYQTYPNGGNAEVPVIYAAIQETVIDNIKDALTSVGIDNFSINNPYGSVINGLVYLGKLDKQINSGEIWNFVQITNNGFTLFSMVGTVIREINDMPLPLKTFAPDEVYETMAIALQNNLSIYPASSLFVLSRTDLLSAQQLLQRMELRGNVDYLENNGNITEPFIDIGEKVDSDFWKFISIECIGSAVTTSNSPLVLCYMTNKDLEDEVIGTFPWGNKEVIVNDATITYIFIGAIICIVLLGGLFYAIPNAIANHIDGEISKLQNEKSDIERKISQAEKEGEGNVDTIIAKISKNNKNAVLYFNSISTEIPSNIWLSYYYSDAEGALKIKGDTANVESLRSFFDGMKNSVQGSRINLSKLEYNDIDSLLDPTSNGNKTLKFEITSNITSEIPSIDNKENSQNNSNDENKNENTTNNTTENESSDDNGLPEPPPFDPPATN